MAHFEREIYRNPSQNLDKLWYDLNLKYMGLNYDSLENSSSWAANKFATSLACNTHNLVLADVFAAQLQHAIESRVIQEGNYLNNDAIGEYLKVNLYQYGNTVPWEKLIEKATGEPLNTAYFVNYLVGEQHN
jgi:peptidyl-dipeptidase A